MVRLFTLLLCKKNRGRCLLNRKQERDKGEKAETKGAHCLSRLFQKTPPLLASSAHPPFLFLNPKYNNTLLTKTTTQGLFVLQV